MAAFVAVTKIQNNVGASASGSVTSTASNALLATAIDYFTGAVSTPTFTVSGGGTWTTDGRDAQHFTSTNDNQVAAFASTPSATGGTQTVTITWGSGASFTGFICEFSGAAASSILDTLGTGTQGTASPVSSQSLTNAGANAIFLAIGGTASSSAETHASTGTGWTMPTGGDETDGAAQVTAVTGYKIVSSIASQTETWTDSPSGAWSSFIAAYKQAGGGGATPTLIPLAQRIGGGYGG